ncbi:MAG: hypothetical protein H8E03_00730 [Pelagibacteraceae bacterium]|nr:hypothetical protein [Pelagibacteraceae bacterium]
MALIDLSRQAKSSEVGGKVLRTSDYTSSATGLYEVEWDTLSLDEVSTGSIDTGKTNYLASKNIYLYDSVETSGGGNIYSTGSYGTNIVLTINPLGHPTGSVKVWGDLIVEGTSSVHNVTTVSYEDPILDLNYSGSVANSSADGGLNIGRSGGTNAQLLWDESERRWSIDNSSGSFTYVVGSNTEETLTNKTITNLATSTMFSGANLTFSGDGEILGLPSTASIDTAATSKLYVQHRLDYLRKTYVKKASSFLTSATVGSVSGYSTASFSATSASAPTGLTATSEDDFIFFLNGQYMEHDALEIEQSGSQFLLKVDVNSIGYVLESDDEILAHGKFIS